MIEIKENDKGLVEELTPTNFTKKLLRIVSPKLKSSENLKKPQFMFFLGEIGHRDCMPLIVVIENGTKDYSTII